MGGGSGLRHKSREAMLQAPRIMEADPQIKSSALFFVVFKDIEICYMLMTNTLL